MSKELERCELCDEPTGNAGIDEDSIVCDICNRVICEECEVIFYPKIICKECYKKND